MISKEEGSWWLIRLDAEVVVHLQENHWNDGKHGDLSCFFLGGLGLMVVYDLMVKGSLVWANGD